MVHVDEGVVGPSRVLRRFIGSDVPCVIWSAGFSASDERVLLGAAKTTTFSGVTTLRKRVSELIAI